MLPFNDFTITAILKNTMAGRYKFTDKRLFSPSAKDFIESLLKNKAS